MKRFLIGFVFVAMIATLLPQSVFAGLLNTHPKDYDTLRVGNMTQNPGSNSSSWTTTVTAYPGDLISLAAYYHNTSSWAIDDVRVKLTPKTTGVATYHDFDVTIWGENTNPVYGNARVYLASPGRLEYVENSVVWRPNQKTSSSSALPSNQSGNEIFDDRGIGLGTIYPGWSTQGNVVIGFRVIGGEGGSYPDYTLNLNAETWLAENISTSGATLRGAIYSSNNSASAWFEWGSTASLGNRTETMYANLSNGFKSVSSSLSGLAPNTVYYYRLVAQDSEKIDYGEVKFFKTYGNGYVAPVINTVYIYENNQTGLSISKTVENIDNPNGTKISTSAKRGDTVRFTITVSNNTGNDLTNLEIRDRLEDSFRLVNELDKDTDRENERKVIWLVDRLSAGEEKEVFFEALVAEDAKIGDILKNGGDRTVVETRSLLRTSNEVFVEVAEEGPVGAAALVLSGLKFTLALLIFAIMVVAVYMLYRIYKK